MVDPIDKLRQRYQEQIRIKTEEIKALEGKLAVLTELRDELTHGTLPGTSQGKYSKLTLTEAALDAVKTIAPGPQTPTQATAVRRYIVANGFVATGKFFDISVVKALKRLAEQGKIVAEKKEGKRQYYAK